MFRDLYMLLPTTKVGDFHPGIPAPRYDMRELQSVIPDRGYGSIGFHRPIEGWAEPYRESTISITFVRPFLDRPIGGPIGPQNMLAGARRIGLPVQFIGTECKAFISPEWKARIESVVGKLEQAYFFSINRLKVAGVFEVGVRG